MKKYKEKFRYLDARLKISFVVVCILSFLLVLCLDREWIFPEGFWKIAMIFLPLLLVGFTYLWIWKPYRRLTNQVQRFSDGYISLADLTDVEVAISPEFERMARHMNKIVTATRTLDMSKRQAQYRALQNQINPHFLYNTLDSIIWMAEGKKNEEVVLMTASLARLLRQSISNEDEVVPIANEVEYARGYLTIQKMRYKDKLEFQIEVDSSILYIPLIKLVLQPIIENAIYHGLKYKESKGLLIVKGFMKDGNAVLQVIDDGVGMDEETLAHIYDKHKVNYHSNGVGVYNVQKRLKLYYGEDYGITYTSELGKGTTATITIPGRQEGQM